MTSLKHAISALVGADRGVIGEAADATNDVCPCQDGAQLVIACPMNCNGDIVFIILLEFKSDGDAVGKV